MNTFLQILSSLFAVTLIHEMGHVISAKLYGLKVSAVAIFYAPVITITMGETKISIGVIPMGGYTLIPGLYKLTKIQQKIVNAGGIILNILTFIITLFYFDIAIVKAIGIFSIVLAVLNLLPADPFDGRKIFMK